VNFTPLFVSIFQTWLCDIQGANLHGSKTRNRQDNRVEPQRVSAVVTCAVVGLSVFYCLVSIRQPWVCAIPGAQLLGSTAGIQRDIRADCFCSSKQRCCTAERVLLLGFKVQSDIFAVMIAWS